LKYYLKCYHATDFVIEEFNLDWLIFGDNNFGPGIYFSTRSDNIDFYLNGNPNGNIYQVEIPLDSMVKWYDLIDDNILEQFLLSLPIEFHNLNKDYLVKKYKNKNYLYIFDNLPYEIINSEYYSDTYFKEFLIKMSENTGISSMFMQNGTFRDEVVLFNPKVIKNKKKIN